MLRLQNSFLVLLTAGLLSGCSDSSEFQDYDTADLSDNTTHAHAHGAEGVHGGHVIELGDAHAFHAELVFDAATRDITLYFYGNTIGTAAPASGLVFELESGDDESELTATASPLDGETEDTCSRYVIAGTAVPTSIKGEEQLDGHFHVTLGGSEYVGEMHAHSHDHGDAHADHGDAHDDHGDDHAAGHDKEKGHEHGEDGDNDEEHGDDHDHAKEDGKK